MSAGIYYFKIYVKICSIMGTAIKYVLLVLILAGLGYGAYYYQNKTNTPARPEGGPAGFNPPPAGQEKIMQWSEPPKIAIDATQFFTAVIDTTAGKMTVQLFAKENPITVNNFVFLARQDFYNGTRFHRIIKDFMIQGGDPECNPSTSTGRCGAGGPGYKFNDEPITRDYERGTIAMANSGPNTNGSQFFIMTKTLPLQKNYVIFGKVIEGLDTLDKIAATPVTTNPMGEKSTPTEDVLIKSIRIEVVER